MAPHVGFDTDQIKDKARKDLLYLLEGVRGKKNLVLERGLAGPINLFVKFSTLQEYGVDKLFFLENGNADVSQRNVVFVARGESARHAQSIAELEDSFSDLYLHRDPTPTFVLARALMLIQQKHGLFPRITGKGDNAKRVADLLARMRQELIAGEDTNETSKLGLTPSTTIESLIVIDREVDYATPLLTQLTYEGLIDEVVRIQNNQADVDSSIVGTVPQPAPGSSKTVGTAPVEAKKQRIILDSSDKLYDQLRDTNFAIIKSLLNKVARRLQNDFDARHSTKTTAELREFVNKLPGYQAEQRSLKIHIALAEEIFKHTRTDQFSRLLEVQQNLAAGADPSSQHEAIEELISRDAPLSEVLRVLCLESCISGGIKHSHLEHFKKMILQAYGYQHLLTLDALEKLQLLLSRSSPMAAMIPMTGGGAVAGAKTNYTYLRKALRLIVDEVNEHDPNDIAYKQYLTSITRGGNAHNAAGVATGGASQGWRGFDEAVKHARGATFDEVQKGEVKAVKARALLTGSGEKKVVFIVFLGGITFTEIAALRFIAKQEEGMLTERHRKPASDGSLYLRPESARDSMASSMTTDIDDGSSALSSISSKGTSPTGFDPGSRETAKAVSHTGKRREKYDIRPKVSIPTDIAPSEYARQCIAAAESSRLNPYSLHPEEHAMLRKHITHQQVTTYLNIRNGILRLWTRNPLIGVERDEAIGCAKDPRWFDIASVCHEWLVRRGYINYGCLEHLATGEEVKKQRSGKRKRKTVAIIGAGMSGLGCARQLEALFSQFEDRFREKGEDPPQVVVLEGRDRIGGRVYSRAFNSKPKYPTLSYGNRHTAEMGGMIITGFDRGNPLNIIVRGQLALPYHALKPDTTIYDANGRPVDMNRDQFAEKLFNYILDRVSEYKFKIPTSAAVDGDKDLLDAGRDVSSEGSKTISEIEDAPASAPPAGTNDKASRTPEVQMVPVSSDRLTGRAHLEPAKEIGWLLRPGTAVNSRYATLGSVFDEAIRQYTRIVDFTPLDLRLINWHVANLDLGGKHTMVTGGYQQPLTVKKKSNVKKITYAPEHTGSPSKIECEDGTSVDADYIVSTIPLGVLKQHSIMGPIQRIGFGILNKVVLVYEEAFWDQSRDIFGALRNPANRFSLSQTDYFTQRGRFFQWFNCTNTTGLPTLMALMAGDAAFSTESTPNDVLISEATKVLRTLFGPKVPNPIEAVVTRWGQDQFARGSYSYTGPNFQPDDYEVMAKPIGNLFFAGEHTCGTHPATVHGAYISGLRAASEIPEPLVLPKDSGLKRKSEVVQSPKDPKQARLETYEIEIWNAIYAKLGDRPWRPANNYANPYRMYSKDKWEEAKRKCEEGRRPGKGKPIPNEVKKMVTKMWKEASEVEKRPYNEKADVQKKAYATAMAEYNVKAGQWDKDALTFRAVYEKEHPSVPGPEELLDSPSRRDRRAKRGVSGYAEDSGSELDI
ncbi:putative lysine-specific histone demethylase 1A [Hyaloscypha finlandica]|nr:putative lysine-specific histone demethylase 1A [Hyaloscypha finlandica]